MITQVSRTYSLEEYLELETTSETRNEYIDGEIVPMTGGMPNHNRIIRNLCTAFTVSLREHPYEVFVADQRLWIPQRRIATYPDVMVMPGELAYQEGRRDTLTNPVLIVEVLSKSTRDYDRGNKFAAYRTIPAFQEYLLVDQYGCQIEHYSREGVKKWVFQEYDELEDVVELASLPFAIAIHEIYAKVEFEPMESAE